MDHISQDWVIHPFLNKSLERRMDWDHWFDLVICGRKNCGDSTTKTTSQSLFTSPFSSPPSHAVTKFHRLCCVNLFCMYAFHLIHILPFDSSRHSYFKNQKITKQNRKLQTSTQKFPSHSCPIPSIQPLSHT